MKQTGPRIGERMHGTERHSHDCGHSGAIFLEINDSEDFGTDEGSRSNEPPKRCQGNHEAQEAEDPANETSSLQSSHGFRTEYSEIANRIKYVIKLTALSNEIQSADQK
ncbi:hypothetical protein HDE_07898 [Halotydeus destructor]|nr:hypothetical protein HDE_07898 [Halotydeus destructor]